MSASFGFRHSTIAAGTTPTRVLAFSGNINRLSVAFAISTVTNLWLFNVAGTQLTGVIAILRGPATLIMPYRDWGEIIRQDIFVSCDAAGTSVYGVDLYRLPIGEK